MDLNLTIKHLKKDEEKLAKELKKYAKEKLGKVEEFLPSHAKKTARIDAVLDKSGKKAIGYDFKFEAKLKMPEKNLIAKLNAKTAEEAINKAEQKLVKQLRKYKTQHHTLKKMDKKTLAKLRKILKRG